MVRRKPLLHSLLRTCVEQRGREPWAAGARPNRPGLTPWATICRRVGAKEQALPPIPPPSFRIAEVLLQEAERPFAVDLVAAGEPFDLGLLRDLQAAVVAAHLGVLVADPL